MSGRDRVVIYVPAHREWYAQPGRGTTKDRAKAHVYTRAAAEELVGLDSHVEIHSAAAQLTARVNGGPAA